MPSYNLQIDDEFLSDILDCNLNGEVRQVVQIKCIVLTVFPVLSNIPCSMFNAQV